MKTVYLSATLLFLSISVNAQTYTLDKTHAKLGFSITHMLISEVEGQFKSFDIQLVSKKEDLSDASVVVTADMSSVDTDNEQRDEHLKGADFFDVANYPQLKFVSTSYKKAGSDKYQYVLTGDLTMHGVTKTVILDVTYNGSIVHPYTKKTVLGFKIKGKIKRSDFSISSATPDNMLSDVINLNSNVEFVKD